MQYRWSVSVALAAALLGSWSGCGGCNHHPLAGDARLADGAVDSATAPLDGAPDAAAVADAANEPDAACVTYTPDAASAVASPACTSGATTYVDFGASVASNIVMAGSTLYASVYDTASPGGAVTAGRVVAIDLTSGTQSVVLSTTGEAFYLSRANGWIFATDSGADASIWRWRNGEAPVAVLQHRAYLGAVTADDTDMFWNEAGSGSTQANVIQEQPLCGGTITTLITGCVNSLGLVNDAQHVYCAAFGQDVYEAPKDGSSAAMGIAYDSYPWTSMILVGDTLFATDGGDLTIHKIPTPAGPVSTFASTFTMARFYGLAASDAYLYGTASSGVYRISRATGAYKQLTTDSTRAAPVLWNGQLFYLTPSTLRRCTD